MTRFRLLIFISVLHLFSYGCQVNTPKSPNIIFILVDDLGWSDLGCYGSTFYETPNIDRLAGEGIRFTNAYAASPVCSPTRAAIMTGKYPSRLNITDWIPGMAPTDRKLLGPTDADHLALEENTIGEKFAEEGYKTFFAGKWHLGSEGFYPEDQGFGINIGGHEKGQPPGGYYSPYGNPRMTDGPEGEYLTDRLTEEAIRFMEINHTDPFFVFLSYYTVHTPIQANTDYIGHFRSKLEATAIREPIKKPEGAGSTVLNQVNADYASMVYAMDVNVGRVLETLKSLGLDENTIVLFTSDNGGLSTLAGSRTAPTSVAPLRAGKGWCYEGGIRVPMIFKAPGIEGSREINFPTISMDLFPTLMELARIPMGSSKEFDGLSLAGLMTGEVPPDREEIFWHFPHYHGSAWTPGAAIRRGNWKLIQFYEEDRIELYDLSSDIGEENDLSSQFPDKVAELQGKLRALQRSTNSNLPMPNPVFPVQ